MEGINPLVRTSLEKDSLTFFVIAEKPFYECQDRFFNEIHGKPFWFPNIYSAKRFETFSEAQAERERYDFNLCEIKMVVANYISFNVKE